MHLLHDDQEELFRNFLSCIIRPESFKNLNGAQLLHLELSENDLLPDTLAFDFLNSVEGEPFHDKAENGLHRHCKVHTYRTNFIYLYPTVFEDVLVELTPGHCAMSMPFIVLANC